MWGAREEKTQADTIIMLNSIRLSVTWERESIFLMAQRDRTIMNWKKHQEDKFHMNRKKTSSESELSEGTAVCFECLSCPNGSWTATLWWTVHVGCVCVGSEGQASDVRLEDMILKVPPYPENQRCLWDQVTGRWWARKRACLLDSDSLVFPPCQTASKQISGSTMSSNDDSIHSAAWGQSTVTGNL